MGYTVQYTVFAQSHREMSFYILNYCSSFQYKFRLEVQLHCLVVLTAFWSEKGRSTSAATSYSPTWHLIVPGTIFF